MSSDRDPSSFGQYFGSMPWAAVSFESPLRQKLGAQFGVRGIPCVVILSAEGEPDEKIGCALRFCGAVVRRGIAPLVRVLAGSIPSLMHVFFPRIVITLPCLRRPRCEEGRARHHWKRRQPGRHL